MIEFRLCKLCSIVEDEHHALFVCSAHHGIRLKFEDSLKWTSVAGILYPTAEEDMIIEGDREKYGLFRHYVNDFLFSSLNHIGRGTSGSLV